MLSCQGGCDRSDAGATVSKGTDASAVPWFNEVAAERGLVFRHESGHKGRYLFPEIMVGGAALFDMDNDGDLDAYLVQSGSLTDPPERRPGNQLFRNRGDGTFEDATAGSGADDRGYGMGVAAGDIDNDGDTDLYVTNVGEDVLLRNDGAGRFTDITQAARISNPGWSASAAMVDIDQDGWLDIYVTNYVIWSLETDIECFNAAGGADYCSPNSYNAPARDTLFRNNGDGTFADISVAAGLNTAFGNGLGVLCGDFDQDGWVDIFVANDGQPNQLWTNQKNGTFRDTAFTAGCALDNKGMRKAGMGVTAADLNEDALLDVLVVNMANESDSYFANQPGGFFTDLTAAVGLGFVSRAFTRFGAGFVDFNNDGALDLYEANGKVQKALGPAGPDPFAEINLLLAGSAREVRFVEVQPRGGTREPLVHTSRAAAFGDVDNDGGVDILVVNKDANAYLLHNRVPSRGNWVGLRVIEESGRDALGATITLQVGDRKIVRDVRSAYSYLAANDPRVHVGLGSLDRATNVTVRWPGRGEEHFGDVAAGSYHTLKRGSGRPAATKLPTD